MGSFDERCAITGTAICSWPVAHEYISVVFHMHDMLSEGASTYSAMTVIAGGRPLHSSRLGVYEGYGFRPEDCDPDDVIAFGIHKFVAENILGEEIMKPLSVPHVKKILQFAMLARINIFGGITGYSINSDELLSQRKVMAWADKVITELEDCFSEMEDG